LRVPLDPRTPVIAGVGQVTSRPTPNDAATWSQPLALMVDALQLAGEDASSTPGVRSSLLERIDVLTAVPSFVWRHPDPARATATRLGLSPRSTNVTFAGGTVPQRALFDAARRISAGELDVAAIVGSEAMKSRDLMRRALGHEELRAEEQAEREAAERGDPARAEVLFEVAESAVTDLELNAGLALPVHTYALFEHALRRSEGQSRGEHVARLNSLVERMSSVAQANPLAWLRDPVVASSAATPSASNRMVSFPYTKLLASNVVVDMGAAVVVCSLEAARAAGVPDDQLVFPQRGAYALEQWVVSTRTELSQSLAMRACARSLFGAAPPSPDALELIDLYSCFPCAVQMGAAALGIDVLGDERPPTVTGGMTFFGGPGNNYVTHSLATMTERLRERPGATGLVTGLGWYASTHAWGTYSTTPPEDPFEVANVQSDVDATPLREVDPDYEGEAVVESYTVGHDRGEGPTRAIVSLRTPRGARRIMSTDDAQLAAAIEAADPLDGPMAVRGGVLRLP
jgi:acetyl-CoA C-acetyltransferase